MNFSEKIKFAILPFEHIVRVKKWSKELFLTLQEMKFRQENEGRFFLSDHDGEIKSVTTFGSETEARAVKEALPNSKTVSVMVSPDHCAVEVSIEDNFVIKFAAQTQIKSKEVQQKQWKVKKVQMEETNYDLFFQICSIYGLAKLKDKKKVITGTGIALINAFNSVGVASFYDESKIIAYIQTDLKKFRDNLRKELHHHAKHLNLNFSEEEQRKKEYDALISTQKHFEKLKENKENKACLKKRHHENDHAQPSKRFKYNEKRNMDEGINFVELNGEVQEADEQADSNDTGYVEQIPSNRKKLIHKSAVPSKVCSICKTPMTLCKVNKLGSAYKGYFFLTCNRLIKSFPLRTCNYSEYFKARVISQKVVLDI